MSKLTHKERAKPTIAELEDILKDPNPRMIQLHHDGSITSEPDVDAMILAAVEAAIKKNNYAWEVEYVKGVAAETEKWRPAVETVLRGFDEDVFVRSIEYDSDPGWAMKLLPFIQALAQLSVAIRNEPDVFQDIDDGHGVARR